MEVLPDVLGRAAAGDLTAFPALIRLFQPVLFGLVYSIVKNRDDADEVINETWLRVWKERADFLTRPPEYFHHSVTFIARNLAVDRLPARDGWKRRRRPLSPPGDGEREGGVLPEPADGQTPDPTEDVVRKEKAEALQAALARALALLQADTATALLMRADEKNYEEIAAALGRSVLAIGPLLTRGRQALRALLQEELSDDWHDELPPA